MAVSNIRRGPPQRGGGTTFNYKPRSAESAESRINKYNTGNRETFIDSGIEMYTPKEGDNWIRILPPTWNGADEAHCDRGDSTDENPSHYAFNCYVHYEVGPDNGTYLCLEKMRGEFCPLCEELRKAQAAGSTEYARALESSLRLAAWVIDRESAAKGPMLWLYSPNAIDKEILLQSRDRRTGEVLAIDHPTQGYDVEFTRKGKGLTTKYSGIKLARQPSDVPQSALDFVVANPIPTKLKWHDAAHIEEVFSGVAPEAAPAAQQQRTEPEPQPQPEPQKAATPPARAALARPATPPPRPATPSTPASTPAPVSNAERRRAAAAAKPSKPDFAAMTLDQQLDWADAHSIVIPDNVADAEIGAFLAEQDV